VNPAARAQAEPLLSVEDLRVQFATEDGLVHAVENVSFDLRPGEILGIVGESGSGKSVTAQTLMGLTRSPNASISGSVRFHGMDLVTATEEQLQSIRGREISMVFQDPMTSLNPVYRVGDQIIEQIEAHKDMPKEETKERAVELLASVGIPNAKDRVEDYPYEFSGGMRQRAMIAMALALEPRILIADEPTTALDVTIQAQIMKLIQDLNEERGLAVILITHDLGVIAEVVDRVLVMYAGQIVEHATALDLFDRPEHPYTEALLSALPQVEGEGIREGRLLSIPGRPPDLIDPPPACRFAPRCLYAGQDDCAVVPPELREIRPDHWVRSAHPASERAGEPVGVT
jgi:oligopeptide/dipeptide ABC transporter ATP-binding protein